MEKYKREKGKGSVSVLTSEQIQEFELNRLGYYCKVRSVWDGNRKKNSFKFDIIQYENDKEVIIQKGTKVFSVGEIEAIKKRNAVIGYYLNKLENGKHIHLGCFKTEEEAILFEKVEK